MSTHPIQMILYRQMSRRRILVLPGQLTALMLLRFKLVSSTTPNYQGSNSVGYGQGSYGEGEYPAFAETYTYLPLVTKKEK